MGKTDIRKGRKEVELRPERPKTLQSDSVPARLSQKCVDACVRPAELAVPGNLTAGYRAGLPCRVRGMHDGAHTTCPSPRRPPPTLGWIPMA